MVELLAHYFFVSSRRRHTMLVSDWSSDVCSSDLVFGDPAQPDVEFFHMEELNVWLRRVTKDPDFALFPLPFTLESGRVELQPYFRQVEMRRYEDNLQVTEIEPLIAYIRSTARGR